MGRLLRGRRGLRQLPALVNGVSAAVPIKIADLSSLRQFSKDGPMSLPVFGNLTSSRILCLEPGQSWQGTSNGQQLVYIVLDGQGELSAADKTRQLGVAAIALIEPGTEHTLANNRDDRFAVLRIETKA
jgi:quercetin dioxygenase-like cupin family protein